MSAEYKIRASTPAGVLIDEFTDFLQVGYRKVVNDEGLATIVLPGNHPVIGELENRSQIELWRRDQLLGLDWAADFHGLYLDQQRDYEDSEVFTMACPEIKWLLGTRHVLWYANTANRSVFITEAAESIMKTLVDYNCGPNATTGNGRLRNGTITGLSIQTDDWNGYLLNVYCAWANVLEILQEVAAVGGGDFDLVKTGAQAWEFRWYNGQLGTNRASTLTFSLAFGNMANPRYRYNRRAEKTVAIAAGQGEQSARDTAVRTSGDYGVNNDTEVFVDAREVEKGNIAGLQHKADTRLAERRAIEEFSFDVLQTPSCAYGVHYFLGDLVSAEWGDITATEKVVGVSISVEPDGSERIDVEMETQ